MQSLSIKPVADLKGVGPKVAEKLAAIGLKTVQDVLFHLPQRYEDRTRIYPIADLKSGVSATIIAEVKSANISYGRRRMLLVTVADQTGSIKLRFFYFSAAQVKNLSRWHATTLFWRSQVG